MFFFLRCDLGVLMQLALCRYGVALYRYQQRAGEVHLVVVDILHGGVLPNIRYLVGTHAAFVCSAESSRDHGPDRGGKSSNKNIMF